VTSTPGWPRGERGDPGGEDAGGDALERADADPSAQRAARGAGGLAQALGAGEHGAGVDEDLVARGGRDRAGAVAHEQRDPELALERGDRTAHARLGQRQPRGGRGERAALGDGDEGLELREGHGGMRDAHWRNAPGDLTVMAARVHASGAPSVAPP
jgi:hypothetical protein